MSCIFCKIVAENKHVLSNDSAILITAKDVMAPHHKLVISKEHFCNVGELGGLDMAGILYNMFYLIQTYAQDHGLDESGYRLVINTGKDAGQTIQHLHIHLLGGSPLQNEFGAIKNESILR